MNDVVCSVPDAVERTLDVLTAKLGAPAGTLFDAAVSAVQWHGVATLLLIFVFGVAGVIGTHATVRWWFASERSLHERELALGVGMLIVAFWLVYLIVVALNVPDVFVAVVAPEGAVVQRMFEGLGR